MMKIISNRLPGFSKSCVHSELATDVSRWERLERYARWRQNKLRLDLLPDEVLHLIISHLDRRDMYNLVECLVGFRPNILHPKEIMRIPQHIQSTWIEQVLCDRFEERIYSFTETALYYAREVSSIVMLIDWSTFANIPAVPVAEYRWTMLPNEESMSHSNFRVGVYSQLPSAMGVQVITNRTQIRNVVSEMIRLQKCGVRLTLHRHMLFLDKFNVIDPVPFVNEVYVVVPHTLHTVNNHDAHQTSRNITESVTSTQLVTSNGSKVKVRGAQHVAHRPKKKIRFRRR